MSRSIDAELIDAFVTTGQGEKAGIPQGLENPREAWDRIMCGNEPWQAAGRTLDRQTLRSLINGLVLYSQARPGGTDGSVSPVLPLFRAYVERFPEHAEDLARWVHRNARNDYERREAWGCLPRTSLTAQELEAERERNEAKWEGHLRQEREQREAALRNADEATANLLGTVLRGDIAAFKALVAKGGNPERITPVGTRLSTIAEEHGRSKMAAFLREQGL